MTKRIIPFGKPMIFQEEKDAVLEVLNGPILVHGPKALEFENSFAEFTKADNAISVSSCTAGMHLIYFTLGIGQGDEVIVPAQTHVATAHAVELTGAKCVFVDAAHPNGNIDLTKIQSKLNDRTKAIAVVHYLGSPVNLMELSNFTKEHNLFLLEDCALSPGAEINNVHTGLIGDAGVFSFYPVKHLTTAEGGMIITKHSDLAAKLKLTKAFGVDRTHGERKLPGFYDVPMLGFNYRMSELHAAIGIEQLKRLPVFLEKRQENFQYLDSLINNYEHLSIVPQDQTELLKSSYYCMSVLLKGNLPASRHKIMEELTEEGVGTSIYYPQPVPRMKYYKDKYNLPDSDFEIASIYSDHSICLPVGPHLDKDDMAYIAKKIIEVVNKYV